MILDNIIIFLNVLEQFAIRVTIFSMDVEDIIKYVNKLYFNDDDIIKIFLSNNSNNNINPEEIIQNCLKQIDKEIFNNITYSKLNFEETNINSLNFRLIY